MKKLLTALLALCLLCTMVFAASAETGLEGGSKDVTATATDTTPVYSVEISWGSMAFTYNPNNLQWDPDTLAYKTVADAKGVWAPAATGANEITVVNKSNVPVNAAVAFAGTKETVFESIEGTFNYTIQTAIGGNDPEIGDEETYEKAVELEEATIMDTGTMTYSAVFELSLTGDVTDLSAFNGSTGVGTVTVTLSAVAS